MTIKEAIEILPCIGKPEHIYSLQECEAIQISIESLVKQIPQKPLIFGTELAGYGVPLCPVCSQNGVKILALSTTKYCPQCGQKLDWSNIET